MLTKLGGPLDIIIIDAMHSRDDVSEDLRGARHRRNLYYCMTFFTLELITRKLRSWESSKHNAAERRTGELAAQRKMVPSDNQIDVQLS
jgi:hypothetical protein